MEYFSDIEEQWIISDSNDYMCSVDAEREVPEWLLRHSENVCLRVTAGSVNERFESEAADDCVAALFLRPWIAVCVVRWIPPSSFLSRILLLHWENVWPCRAKQQLWSQSVPGSVWHHFPQGGSLRWIRHPKETLQAPACSEAPSSFFIVLLFPANVEEWKSVCTTKTLLQGKVVSWSHTQVLCWLKENKMIEGTWVGWLEIVTR